MKDVTFLRPGAPPSMQSNSFPLSESVLFKGNISIGLLALLWTFLPSLVAALSLYGLAQVYGESTDQYFGVMQVVVFALCMLIMQPARNITSQLAHPKASMAMETVGRWLVLLFALLVVGFFTKSTPVVGRRVLLTWALLTPAFIVIASLAIQQWMRQLTLDIAHQRRVLFAGCNDSSMSLARRIKNHPELCMSVAGFFDDRSATRLGHPNATLLGGLRNLAPYVRRHDVDIIFIALPIRHMLRVTDLLDELRDTTASIYYVPDIFAFDLIQARTSEVIGMPVVAMCETPLHGLRGLSKRLFDIVAASVALLITAPLFVVFSALIRATSPGEAIFKQRRYGLDGKEITVYKFRTMTVTEDGSHIPQAVKEDPRVTAIGRFLRKTSLDELPQLINVLQGTMSLVGPRPHAVAHNEMYRKLIKGYMIRHKVLPGITGLAQINGYRGEIKDLTQMEARVNYDLEYLRRWSIFLDLEILANTVLRVFSDKNAY